MKAAQLIKKICISAFFLIICPLNAYRSGYQFFRATGRH